MALEEEESCQGGDMNLNYDFCVQFARRTAAVTAVGSSHRTSPRLSRVNRPNNEHVCERHAGLHNAIYYSIHFIEQSCAGTR